MEKLPQNWLGSKEALGREGNLKFALKIKERKKNIVNRTYCNFRNNKIKLI